MKVYFTFDYDRLHDKELASEMESHMNASHMKNDIPKALEYLKAVKDCKIPRGSYHAIETRQSGVYLKKGHETLKIDLRKSS